MLHFCRFVLLLASCSLVYVPIIDAATLDDFEASIASGSSRKDSTNQQSSDDTRSNECDSDNTDFSCIFATLFIDLIPHLLHFGGAASLDRVSGEHSNLSDSGADFDENMPMPPRLAGEALLPFLRLDGGYQRNSATVSANYLRIEAGYGPVALLLGQTQYHEKSIPPDTLRLTRLAVAYRMSFGTSIEMDWGMGRLNVAGNAENSYPLITTPILIHPSPLFGVEFRPMWSTNLAEYDVALLLKQSFAAVKIGYRDLRSHSQSLHGPYVGLSLFY